MRVIIVAPGHPGPHRKSFPPATTAPYLAALVTPYASAIKVYDLAVEPFNYNAAIPDVALLTSTAPQFAQIYDIAFFLKSRGAKIILGGPHPTLSYHHDARIKEIADSVILGEGERALPQALSDYSDGKLKPAYSIPVDSLDGIPFSRLDLLDRSKYYFSTVLFATRGCVNDCAYCVIRDIYGHKHLKRPTDEVIEEIRFQTSRHGLSWLERKLIQFWDDNPACDLNWFHELLEKMIPLKKWWFSQMCVNIADSKETLRLMKASGCKGLLVGFESVSDETLRAQRKKAINSANHYIRQASTLLKHGITLLGTFMYGFDEDTKQSLFEDTPRMVEEMGLCLLHNHIVVPYPHTQYYRLLKEENRLLTEELKYYNGYTVVHKPKNMHPFELQKGFITTRQNFYSPRSVLKRMLKQNLCKMPEFLVWNFLYRKPNFQVVPGVSMNDWMKFLNSL